MATDVTTRQIEFAPPADQEEENSWALFSLAWRRKWIVFALIAIGLGLGYLFYLQQTPIYQATAQVLIVRDGEKNLPIEGVEISSSFDFTHETLIRSPLVLQKAIDKLDIPSLSSLARLWRSYDRVEDEAERRQLEEKRNLDIARAMAGNLSVEVGGAMMSGEILLMTYDCVSPEDCPKILHAVKESYQEFLGGTYKEEARELTDLVRKATDTLKTDIEEANRKYMDFKNSTLLVFANGSAENPHNKNLLRLEDDRSELKAELIQLQMRVQEIDKAIEQGANREALNLMVLGLAGTDSRDGDEPPASPLQEALVQLMVEKRTLLESFGPDHPAVKKLEAQIRSTKEEVLGTSVPEEADDFLENYLESQRLQIGVYERTLAALDQRYAAEHEEAKKLSDAQIEEEQLRSELRRLEGIYNVVLDRLQEIDLVQEKKATDVLMTHPPGEIGYQVAPELTTIMTASGLLGLLAGMGLAFLVDSADRRFRSPAEIRSDLGIPVVGHIPVLPGIKREKRAKRDDNGEVTPGILSPALRTFHHPRGRIAEAYRAVRTAIYFSTRGSGHQVIQVTSPSPGDGKSTLSGNLALSIANSGKSCLLIDADFRRPRIHRLFGLDNSCGISSVIEGKTEIVDAVQATDVENLSIMSCGPRPENPAELLSSKRFAELLALLREQHDLVIVDTPPVLAVTDPLNVVARVDGVLLVLRLTKSARSEGGRALEALDGMGANVLGIVINGVGGQAGYGGYGYGYGYGKYGYGYGGRKAYGGYRYGFGSEYGYRYADDDGYGDDSTYYEDDVALPSANGKASTVVKAK